MLDIDSFKEINDSYGHLTGDDAISSMGMILRENIGNRGIAVRYAGDEFIILKHVSDIDELKQIIHKIELAIDNFNKESGKPYRLNFSKGYDLFLIGIDTLDSFLDRIDSHMYEEKKAKKLKQLGC